MSSHVECCNFYFHFQSGSTGERKAVFVLSTPLDGMTADILRDILQASEFQYVIVISSLSPAMHTLIQFGPAEEEMKAFHILEDRLLEWMGNMVINEYVILS